MVGAGFVKAEREDCDGGGRGVRLGFDGCWNQRNPGCNRHDFGV